MLVLLKVTPPSVMFVVAEAFSFVSDPPEITIPSSELFDVFPIVSVRFRSVPKSNLAPPFNSTFSGVLAVVLAAA